MIVCCSTVMTESLRRSTPLFLAVLAVCSPACKHKRASDAQPAVQRASVVSVPTAAAATAKPIDASEAVRGLDRPAPTPRPDPCLVTTAGQDAPLPHLPQPAPRDF